MRMRYPDVQINPLDPHSNDGQQITVGNPEDKAREKYLKGLDVDGSKYDVKGGSMSKRERAKQR